MPSVTVSLYQVSASVVGGTPGQVSDVISVTIDDDDDTLHANNRTDPGENPANDQVFTSPDLEIAGFEVVFRVSVTFTPAGSATPVTLTGAIVVLTLPNSSVSYYLLSDAGTGFAGLAAGTVVTVAGRVGYRNDIQYAEIACFAAGTLISTPSGPSAVEDLLRDDLVLTEDRGPEPVRWIGRTDLGPEALARRPEFRPIRVRAGCLGPGLPSRDLLLSPQHRLLLWGWPVELHLGETEVLAPVRQLLGWPGIAIAEDLPWVSYVHLMFDHHEIVCANGLPAESFFFGDRMPDGLDDNQVREILALFPELGTEAPRPARPFTRAHEVAVLGGTPLPCNSPVLPRAPSRQVSDTARLDGFRHYV